MLLGHVNQRVTKGSTVYTDELRSYRHLSKEGYRHSKVKHRDGAYARGNVHVNGLENF